MTTRSKHIAAKKGTGHTAAKKRYAQSGDRAAARHNPPKHWIVLADHKKAHIYQKTQKGLERIADVSRHCSHPFPEHGCAEDEFLLNLAAWLDAAEQEKAFDRIVLIGPAETLEALHPHIRKNVHDRICAALEREIIEIAEDEIEDHLAEVMWF